MASFRSVCDLVTDAGEVVALVGPAVGNGPLNVVLEGELGVVLPAGVRFGVADQALRAGVVEVDFSRAARWEARPDWGRLRARREGVRRSIAGLQAGLQTGLQTGLQIGSLLKQAGPAVEAAVAEFEQAWRHGSSAALRSALCHLIGLGPGLTPAGDDWLAGWLLGRQLDGELCESALSQPKDLRELQGLIVEVAAERTTTLSCAFLECAAAGEADEVWHELFDALAEEDVTRQVGQSINQPIGAPASSRVGAAVDRILRRGATSGAAMFAGFWAAIELMLDV